MQNKNEDISNNSSPFRGLGGLRWLVVCDSLLFAILGYLVVHYFARYSGIGVSPDSIMYASTAQNLHDNFSIVTYNGKPLTFFPVFYPFFLSICIFLSGGADPIELGGVINGILFAAAIFLSGWLTTLFKKPSHIYRWIILAAVLLSPAMQNVYTYLWSETLFILQVLIFILAFSRYTQTYTTKRLIIAAIIVAVSCITRYAGITMLGAGGLLILIDTTLKLLRKLIHLAIFASVSVSLLIGNLLMNRINTGLSTGTRLPAITPFTENLHYFGVVLMDWAGMPSSWNGAGIAVTISVTLALVMLLVWHVFTKQNDVYQRTFIAFALTYTLFIVIFASISRFEQINSRLISPVFIPVLFSLTSWAPDVVVKLKPGRRWVLTTPLIAAMLVLFYVLGKIDYKRYDDFYEYGIPGYTDDDWNKSSFVVFLKKQRHLFKSNLPIYTDADEAVYMFTGMHSTLLPHKDLPAETEPFFRTPKFYLIDFKGVSTKELVNLEDIKARKHVTLLHDYKEGAVYIVD